MKHFSTVLGIICVCIMMVELSIFSNHMALAKRDFDTARLMMQIEWAEEAAFAASIQSGSLGADYGERLNVTSDPTNVLDVFASVMCVGYDMSQTTLNKNTVLNSIDGAILSNVGGFYVALLSDMYDNAGETDKKLIQESQYKYMWSPKIPYGYEMDKAKGDPINASVGLRLDSGDLDIYDYDEERVYHTNGTKIETINYKVIPFSNEVKAMMGMVDDVYQQDATFSNQYYYQDGGTLKQFDASVLDDKNRIRAINDQLTQTINYYVQKANEAKGGTNYNISLPAVTTGDGYNPVVGNSLIIVLSDAEFAGKANLHDAVMAGHRVTTKAYPVAFTQDGKRYYCWNGQLPMTNTGDVPTKANGQPLYTVEARFITPDECAEAGYLPNTAYLKTYIPRD